jgi:hypothetical protein
MDPGHQMLSQKLVVDVGVDMLTAKHQPWAFKTCKICCLFHSYHFVLPLGCGIRSRLSSRRFFTLETRLLLTWGPSRSLYGSVLLRALSDELATSNNPCRLTACPPWSSHSHYCLDHCLADFAHLASHSPATVAAAGPKQAVHDWSPHPVCGQRYQLRMHPLTRPYQQIYAAGTGWWCIIWAVLWKKSRV